VLMRDRPISLRPVRMRRRPAHSSENDARPSDGRGVGVSADVLSDVAERSV
jgi:hypothetical protein